MQSVRRSAEVRDLSRFTVSPDSTIREAVRAIETTGAGIAFVVDADRHLLGTLTDGDVRRALLAGVSLDAPVIDSMTREFRSVSASRSRVDVLELMQAWSVNQVPVLSAEGRLVALHLLRDIVGFQEIPNWAIVMAGGRGSRLGALTNALPKPMIPIAGRPILERIVLQLIDAGIRTIYLSINYLGEVIERHFGDGSQLGCSIRYLREKEPLGTGGPLALLPLKPNAPIVVMNGDLLTQAPIHPLLSFHDAGGQMATIALRRYFHEIPFGCVETDGELVRSLEEKPLMSRMVNTGIYVLDPAAIALITPGIPMTMPELITTMLARGETVRGFEFEEDWLDIGRREDLEIARFGEIR
jgi:dTDP-glucose pyrophosphorylase